MSDPGDTSARRASLYIHVPFCVSKCAYCDFASVADANDTTFARFSARIERDLDRWARVFSGARHEVESVYFGGGTPTLLGEGLIDLLAAVRRRIDLADDVEITIETNPDTTRASLVERLVSAGVNRFSLGVQSFDDATLAVLGRCHEAASAEAAARVLHDSGAAFSVDLICGVPGLRETTWMSSVLSTISTGAGHVSVYPLSIEEGTPLAASIEEGTVREPDPDEAAAQMIAAAELLEAAGLERYEIANYARPGEESRHNLGYWSARPYAGLGPSAASMLPASVFGDMAVGSDTEVPAAAVRVRFVEQDAVAAWLGGGGESGHTGVGETSPEVEYLTAEEAAREDVMLGLRLVAGVPEVMIEAAHLADTVRELETAELLECVGEAEVRVPRGVHGALCAEGARWRLTQRGWLLGNEVFSRVWAGE